MKKQRRRKQPIGNVKHFPTVPGWYVQWRGRTDWQPMDEGSAKLINRILVTPGDRVLHVEAREVAR